jgi:ATP-dependent helicase IRC3
MELRPYQTEAALAILSARRSGVRRMVVSLPTGAGKTVIFSHLARLARRQVLVLAHREELLEQAREKIARAMQSEDVVAIERGADRAPRDARVLVCSIRSLHEERLARVIAGRDIGLVIYDECHHAPSDDNLRVLRQLGVFEDGYDGTLLGFTATTVRADGKGLDAVFERIVYARTLPQLIDDGYLAKLRGFRIATTADLRGLSGAGHDFAEEELAEAVDIEERNALVARSIQELARDRRTIAFCVTVGHARNLSRALNHVGVPAGIVHGAMPSEQRARVLADFREGRIHALTNVGVLTEGFDDPGVSCIAMARPTRSDGLYAQCIGRGTRLAAGKTDCLVLDFVDLSALDLCTLPSLFGLPRHVDLRGDDASDARRTWLRIEEEHPGFEVDPEAVTLAEIKERAASFDPLGLAPDAEVLAISPNAWFSLGRHGVGLHFQRAKGRTSEALVVAARGAGAGARAGASKPARGKRWEVRIDGRTMDRFSRLEDAVAAVDFEIDRMGRLTAESAREDASWRKGSVADELRLALFERIAGNRLRRPSP